MAALGGGLRRVFGRGKEGKVDKRFRKDVDRGLNETRDIGNRNKADDGLDRMVETLLRPSRARPARRATEHPHGPARRSKAYMGPEGVMRVERRRAANKVARASRKRNRP